jgi:hypothetical protein
MAFYTLAVPGSPGTFINLPGVTDDQFVNDREREVLVVIGRGKKVNYGTKLGMTGTLTVKIRELAGSSASSQRDAIEAFLLAHPNLVLNSPWGDAWLVDIGPLNITRIAGTGDSEAVDLSFTYEQLDADL